MSVFRNAPGKCCCDTDCVIYDQNTRTNPQIDLDFPGTQSGEYRTLFNDELSPITSRNLLPKPEYRVYMMVWVVDGVLTITLESLGGPLVIEIEHDPDKTFASKPSTGGIGMRVVGSDTIWIYKPGSASQWVLLEVCRNSDTLTASFVLSGGGLGVSRSITVNVDEEVLGKTITFETNTEANAEFKSMEISIPTPQDEYYPDPQPDDCPTCNDCDTWPCEEAIESYLGTAEFTMVLKPGWSFHPSTTELDLEYSENNGPVHTSVYGSGFFLYNPSGGQRAVGVNVRYETIVTFPCATTTRLTIQMLDPYTNQGLVYLFWEWAIEGDTECCADLQISPASAHGVSYSNGATESYFDDNGIEGFEVLPCV